MRHGQSRIELDGALERLHRGFVVESEQQRHPLVEEALRIRVFRRDGMMMASQSFFELDGARARRRVMLMLRKSRKNRAESKEHESETAHGFLLCDGELRDHINPVRR